jgi:3-hydroxyacyl-[acyl-carrier protein] dehydratase / trans-2-decenoyl-[acyl-carrier protein] isomerase
MRVGYQEFRGKKSFDLADLIAFSNGRLVADPPEGFEARLPSPPFLMVDRIILLEADGRKGRIVAEQDIRLDAWYFQCHMPGDPVQPGCLGVDAIWQLLGFYGTWRGGLGAGRALGCDGVTFTGQIRPYHRIVRFEIDVRRFSTLTDSGASIIIGDGAISVDGKCVAEVRQARTGLFRGIVYADYPWSENDGITNIRENSFACREEI